MNIKDRGTKKWTSLMLPEHVEAIKEVFEEEKRVEKPILDEQQIWESEAKLQLALHNGLTVKLKVYNEDSYIMPEGKVLFMDSINKKINLDNGDINEISFDNIIEVTVL